MGIFDWLRGEKKAAKPAGGFPSFQIINGQWVGIDDNKGSYITNGYTINDQLYSIVNLILDKVRLPEWGTYKVKDEQKFKAYQGLMRKKGLTGEDYKTLLHLKDQSLEPVHEKTEWTGVITLWDYPRLDIRTGTRFGWIKSKIRQFEKQNPGVYIELRELDWNEGPSFLKAAAKIGANPDIAPIGSDYFFISGGYLEGLDGYISLEERADFISSILDTAMYNGKTYGIPWMMTGYTMLLNTDIFSERNVSLPENGEWTYEQFVEALKQLTYNGVYGFNSFIEPGYYNTFGIIMCDGAQIIDDTTGRYIFNTPEAVSGLPLIHI